MLLSHQATLRVFFSEPNSFEKHSDEIFKGLIYDQIITSPTAALAAAAAAVEPTR